MNVRAAQHGVFLIETLVAIVVFSVGVLGAVTLQAQSIRHVDDAHHRAEAAQLIGALVARLWTEDAGTLADRFDVSRAGAGYRDFAARARYLPGGTASDMAPDVRITGGPSPGSRTVAITVRWQMPGMTAPHQVSTTTVVGRN